MSPERDLGLSASRQWLLLRPWAVLTRTSAQQQPDALWLLLPRFPVCHAHYCHGNLLWRGSRCALLRELCLSNEGIICPSSLSVQFSTYNQTPAMCQALSVVLPVMLDLTWLLVYFTYPRPSHWNTLFFPSLQFLQNQRAYPLFHGPYSASRRLEITWFSFLFTLASTECNLKYMHTLCSTLLVLPFWCFLLCLTFTCCVSYLTLSPSVGGSIWLLSASLIAATLSPCPGYTEYICE